MNLYVYLDESGNLDFSNNPGATEWLVLTSLSTTQPSEGTDAYFELRHQLYQSGLDDQHEFHATEDLQHVRNQVFDLLQKLQLARIDSLAIQKRKLVPEYRAAKDFYPFAMEYLLKYVFDERGADASQFDHVIVCIDRPNAPKGQKKPLIQGVKQCLKAILGNINYSLVFAPSLSHPYLQFADYCCWAVYIKHERKEFRPYKQIRRLIHSDFDIFAVGRTSFY